MFNAYVLEGHVTHRQQTFRGPQRDYLSFNFKLDLAHELVGNFHLERPSVGRPPLGLQQQLAMSGPHRPLASER